MSVRYVQAAISAEDHEDFTLFAFLHNPRLTMSDLVEVAVKEYIKSYRKEANEEVQRTSQVTNNSN